jgi:hypothetical protein
MEFNYNDKAYKYPNALSDITLGQRIDLQNSYGAQYEQRLKEAAEIEDADERELEIADINVQYSIECFSFFTGIPLDDVKEFFDVHQVVTVVNANKIVLLGQEHDLKVINEYEFKGEKFVLSPPELTPQNKMTFNEFLTAKEITRQLQQLGKGKIDGLLYLCCVYLRRSNEPFSEDLMDPNGERMKLFRELPLDIAFAVGFFLTGSMNTYLKTLASLRQAAGEKALT